MATTRKLIRPARAIASAMAALSLALMLVACAGNGSGSSDSTASTARLPSAPGGIVARVGPIAITEATYARWFKADVSTEQPAFQTVPVPPEYAACIDHLRQAIKNRGLPTQSRAQLKSKCAAQYQETRARVLNDLIVNEWVVGAAEELGLRLSNATVEQKVLETDHEELSSKAAREAYLRKTGQTYGDVLFRRRVELLTEQIRALLKDRVGVFTPDRVAAYYRAHRSQFSEPETRDLHILRTETLGAALRAREEIASGSSFAKVAASLHTQQPIHSKNGAVRRLVPHGYSQRPLNDAIFSAKTGKLSRPVHITLGYYIFEVTKVHPSHVKPLATVSARIRSEIPTTLQQHAVAAFITRWRRHWSAQTVCAPAFIVRRCRQYKVTPSTPADDAYTFN